MPSYLIKKEKKSLQSKQQKQRMVSKIFNLLFTEWKTQIFVWNFTYKKT